MYGDYAFKQLGLIFRPLICKSLPGKAGEENPSAGHYAMYFNENADYLFDTIMHREIVLITPENKFIHMLMPLDELEYITEKTGQKASQVVDLHLLRTGILEKDYLEIC